MAFYKQTRTAVKSLIVTQPISTLVLPYRLFPTTIAVACTEPQGTVKLKTLAAVPQPSCPTSPHACLHARAAPLPADLYSRHAWTLHACLHARAHTHTPASALTRLHAHSPANLPPPLGAKRQILCCTRRGLLRSQLAIHTCNLGNLSSDMYDPSHAVYGRCHQ